MSIPKEVKYDTQGVNKQHVVEMEELGNKCRVTSLPVEVFQLKEEDLAAMQMSTNEFFGDGDGIILVLSQNSFQNVLLTHYFLVTISCTQGMDSEDDVTGFIQHSCHKIQGLFKVLFFFSRLNRIGKTLDLLRNACRSKHTFIGWRIMYYAIKQWER